MDEYVTKIGHILHFLFLLMRSNPTSKLYGAEWCTHKEHKWVKSSLEPPSDGRVCRLAGSRTDSPGERPLL